MESRVLAGQLDGRVAQGCVDTGLMSGLEGETCDSGVCNRAQMFLGLCFVSRRGPESEDRWQRGSLWLLLAW